MIPLIVIVSILGAFVFNYITIGIVVFIIGILLPLPERISDWLGDHISSITFVITVIIMYQEYNFIFNFISKRIG